MRISIVCTTQNRDWRVLRRRILCHLMEQLRILTGNPLSIFNFFCILLISCLPYVSNKNYHELSAIHIGGLMSISLCHLMEQSIASFCYLYLIILCLPNASKIFYHVTKEDQLSEKLKIRTGECCLRKQYVVSWISYSLKWGIINIMHS